MKDIDKVKVLGLFLMLPIRLSGVIVLCWMITEPELLSWMYDIATLLAATALTLWTIVINMDIIFKGFDLLWSD